MRTGRDDRLRSDRERSAFPRALRLCDIRTPPPVAIGRFANASSRQREANLPLPFRLRPRSCVRLGKRRSDVRVPPFVSRASRSQYAENVRLRALSGSAVCRWSANIWRKPPESAWTGAFFFRHLAMRSRRLDSPAWEPRQDVLRTPIACSPPSPSVPRRASRGRGPPPASRR